MRSRFVSSTLRALVAASALGTASCASPAAASQDVPVAPRSRELSADEQVIHAVSRLTFGARPGDVERVRAIGVDGWIALQLRPDRIDDAATDQFTARYETLRKTSAELYREYPPAALLRAVARRDSLARNGRMTMADTIALLQQARRSNQFMAELTSSRVARAVLSERQLQEVMVDFWENHFSVFAGKGQTRWYLPSYDRDVIRPHALGNFRELLGAVAKSPAMLFYLDNVQSVADSGRRTLAGGNREPGTGNRRGAGRLRRVPAPSPVPVAAQRRRGLNENYARELMELHTLGVDGGYTQDDIVNVARALTGWTMRPREGTGFLFVPALHDRDAKTVLGQAISGGGIAEGERVLDIVAAHPSTARHIAAKLAIKFVSDTPPAALVDRAAARFTASRGNLREVVKTIITSPEFFAADARAVKIKTPLDFIVSALRATNAEVRSSLPLARTLRDMGMAPYFCQPPTGYDDTATAWVNAGALVARLNFAVELSKNQVQGVRVPLSEAETAALDIGAPAFQRQ